LDVDLKNAPPLLSGVSRTFQEVVTVQTTTRDRRFGRGAHHARRYLNDRGIFIFDI
jgi:hypothetical protein